MKINLLEVNYYLVTADSPKYLARKDITLERLAKRNIKPEILYGQLSVRGGWYGFLKAINRQLSKDDFKPFVILEDDVEFFDFRAEVEVPDSADALWLGNSMSMIRYKRIDHNLSQIFGMGSTHAILFISKNFTLSFRQGLEIAGKFDMYYDIPTKIYQEIYEVYTLNTPIFYQDEKLDGQERETKFILAGNKITEEEYNNWKRYRRINMDCLECYVGHPGIKYKIDN